MPYDLVRMHKQVLENEIEFERPTLKELGNTLIGYLINMGNEEARATKRPSLKVRMAAELIRQHLEEEVQLEYDRIQKERGW
jgi:hypothetical protein